MAEITKKQAEEFYHLLYNEVNSTGNTEKNCIALCNFINADNEKIDDALVFAKSILKKTKDICFSIKNNFNRKIVEENRKIVEELNSDFKWFIQYGTVELPVDNEEFIKSYCSFITSDIFSQNSPMNEIADVCYTFLNLKNE